jgi:hypothetical protein
MEHAKGISPRLGDKRAKQKSAFDRTSAFANYKLSAFADYSRPLLLAPRQAENRLNGMAAYRCPHPKGRSVRPIVSPPPRIRFPAVFAFWGMSRYRPPAQSGLWTARRKEFTPFWGRSGGIRFNASKIHTMPSVSWPQ